MLNKYKNNKGRKLSKFEIWIRKMAQLITILCRIVTRHKIFHLEGILLWNNRVIQMKIISITTLMSESKTKSLRFQTERSYPWYRNWIRLIRWRRRDPYLHINISSNCMCLGESRKSQKISSVRISARRWEHYTLSNRIQFCHIIMMNSSKSQDNYLWVHKTKRSMSIRAPTKVNLTLSEPWTNKLLKKWRIEAETTWWNSTKQQAICLRRIYTTQTGKNAWAFNLFWANNKTCWRTRKTQAEQIRILMGHIQTSSPKTVWNQATNITRNK